MKNKYFYIFILLIIIILLITYLMINENYIDKKCVKKAVGTESEYLYPILKNLNESIELSYTCIKPYIITSMGQIKDNKPYIFFNAEPGVKNLKDYKNVLQDKNCVACFVTSRENETVNDKTYYLPFFLCRGPQIFTSSPFERKYIN